jgi:hypothetical protein
MLFSCRLVIQLDHHKGLSYNLLYISSTFGHETWYEWRINLSVCVCFVYLVCRTESYILKYFYIKPIWTNVKCSWVVAMLETLSIKNQTGHTYNLFCREHPFILQNWKTTINLFSVNFWWVVSSLCCNFELAYIMVECTFWHSVLCRILTSPIVHSVGRC